MFEIFLSILLSWHQVPLEKHLIESPSHTQQIIKLDSSRPNIIGKAALIADLNTGKILYQKNGMTKYPIASLTKLMTALIIMEEHSLNEILTVAPQAIQTEGALAHIRANQSYYVKDILKGLLIPSGNDAAIALAVFNAGSTKDFVEKMNKKAKELNLQNTNFANPMGFDDPLNYSTVQDLYKLSLEVYQYPEIQEIVNIKFTTIQSVDKEHSIDLYNTNLVLDNFLNIGGLKTGNTSLAGGCFVGITNNTDNPHITIVLGSYDRFLDTKTMLDWANNTFIYKTL